jgi:hypothetical protein
MCAMHDMSFLNPGHLIPEASSDDCSSHVSGKFWIALSVVEPSNQALVSLTRSSTSLKRTTGVASVYWPWSSHFSSVFETGTEQVINLMKSEFDFTQCPIWIDLVCSDQRYGLFVCGCPSVRSEYNFISYWQFLLSGYIVIAHSLPQMLLTVIVDGTNESSRNALYDRRSSRVDIAFHRICTETNPNKR